MKQYQDLLRTILDDGNNKGDRTGTGTRSIFGYQMRFDLSKGLPILTTKKVKIDNIIHELLWILSGETNTKYLTDNGVNIWNEWADDNGDLGPVYGEMWRKFPTRPYRTNVLTDGGEELVETTNWSPGSVDQIEVAIHDIKNNPNSRRIIVSAWHPAAHSSISKEKCGLPPCHCLFQFYVVDGKLSCQLYQRSADVFIGVPYNFTSYSLLTMMVAQVCDLEPGTFIHTFGDVHIYNNHRDQVKLQLSRTPMPLPIMTLNPTVKDIFDFKFKDFCMIGYHPQAFIPAKVSV